MQGVSVLFKDETGDTIEVGLSFTGEYIIICDSDFVEVYIGVKSIDTLIQALQALKGELANVAK